jgi:hypothetical protein
MQTNRPARKSFIWSEQCGNGFSHSLSTHKREHFLFSLPSAQLQNPNSPRRSWRNFSEDQSPHSTHPLKIDRVDHDGPMFAAAELMALWIAPRAFGDFSPAACRLPPAAHRCRSAQVQGPLRVRNGFARMTAHHERSADEDG